MGTVITMPLSSHKLSLALPLLPHVYIILYWLNYVRSVCCHSLLNCVPGFVYQGGWAGWGDCVPVVRDFELTVSQPLLSETQFVFSE